MILKMYNLVFKVKLKFKFKYKIFLGSRSNTGPGPGPEISGPGPEVRVQGLQKVPGPDLDRNLDSLPKYVKIN